MQNSRASPPGGNALRYNFIRLLRQIGIGLFAMNPARQGTGDNDFRHDNLLGARLQKS
jgi:hypothetical protein